MLPSALSSLKHIRRRNNTHLKHIRRIQVCFPFIYHTFVEAVLPHKLLSKLHLVSLVRIFCKDNSIGDINNNLRMALIVFSFSGCFCAMRFNWEQVKLRAGDWTWECILTSLTHIKNWHNYWFIWSKTNIVKDCERELNIISAIWPKYDRMC